MSSEVSGFKGNIQDLGIMLFVITGAAHLKSSIPRPAPRAREGGALASGLLDLFDKRPTFRQKGLAAPPPKFDPVGQCGGCAFSTACVGAATQNSCLEL